MADFEQSNELPQGYLDIHPYEGKLTVNNLTNFAENDGAFGVADSRLKQIAMSLAMFVVYIVLSWLISTLIGVWFIVPFVWVLMFPLPLWLISVFVFHEKTVKKDWKLRQGRDASFDIKDLFGIYYIENHYPYSMHYTDGSVSVALELVRRSSVGSAIHKEYVHDEVLTTFYNTALSMGYLPILIDTQAANVKDKRFDTLREHLTEISNEDLESIMANIYQHLERNTTSSELTYEYFILMSQVDNGSLEDDLPLLIDTLQGVGYKRVNVLDETKVSQLIADSFGLETFQIKQAVNDIALSQANTSLTLVWLEDANGKRKKVKVDTSSVSNGNAKDKQQTGESKKPLLKDGVENRVLDIFNSARVSDAGDSGKSMTEFLDDEVKSPALDFSKNGEQVKGAPEKAVSAGNHEASTKAEHQKEELPIDLVPKTESSEQTKFKFEKPSESVWVSNGFTFDLGNRSHDLENHSHDVENRSQSEIKTHLNSETEINGLPLDL